MAQNSQILHENAPAVQRTTPDWDPSFKQALMCRHSP